MRMTRYIDADKLLEVINRLGNNYAMRKPILRYLIEKCPKITIGDDATVHGYWIADERYKEQKCSVCHEFGDGKNYCSHCGARMDKEDEE